MLRGAAAGVTEYLVKLDGEKLLESIRRLTRGCGGVGDSLTREDDGFMDKQANTTKSTAKKRTPTTKGATKKSSAKTRTPAKKLPARKGESSSYADARAEVVRVASAMRQGRIDVRAELSACSGDAQDMLRDVNDMLDYICEGLGRGSQWVDAQLKMKVLPDDPTPTWGEYEQLRKKTNLLGRQERARNADCHEICQAVKEGRLR